MNEPRITHVGGPTVLLEIAGWRILSDPTFDPPGRRYGFGWGTSSRKIAGPAVAPEALGPIDVVLVSHDQHADNLDDAGRALLPSAGVVVSTNSAARHLDAATRALKPWENTTISAPGRPDLKVTATPCRHGPPLSRPIVGEVIGFALDIEDAPGTIWFSGDTVLYDDLRDAAKRLTVDIAVLHLGEVQFPITGPVRYSMTARDAVELCAVLKPRVAVPVHYEGWSHFHEGPDEVRRAIADAPPDVRDRFRIVSLGTSVNLGPA